VTILVYNADMSTIKMLLRGPSVNLQFVFDDLIKKKEVM